MIMPDGTEYPVFRPVDGERHRADSHRRGDGETDADALVVECMALIPYLQWLCENRIGSAPPTR